MLFLSLFFSHLKTPFPPFFSFPIQFLQLLFKVIQPLLPSHNNNNNCTNSGAWRSSSSFCQQRGSDFESHQNLDVKSKTAEKDNGVLWTTDQVQEKHILAHTLEIFHKQHVTHCLHNFHMIMKFFNNEFQSITSIFFFFFSEIKFPFFIFKDLSCTIFVY